MLGLIPASLVQVLTVIQTLSLFPPNRTMPEVTWRIGQVTSPRSLQGDGPGSVPNQAYHALSADAPALRAAKRWLRDVFAPADPGWRSHTVQQAVALIDRGWEATFA